MMKSQGYWMRGGLAGYFLGISLVFSFFFLSAYFLCKLELYGKRKKRKKKKKNENNNNNNNKKEKNNNVKEEITFRMLRDALFSLQIPAKLLLPVFILAQGSISSAVVFLNDKYSRFSFNDKMLALVFLFQIGLVLFWIANISLVQVHRHPFLHFVDSGKAPFEAEVTNPGVVSILSSCSICRRRFTKKTKKKNKKEEEGEEQEKEKRDIVLRSGVGETQSYKLVWSIWSWFWFTDGYWIMLPHPKNSVDGGKKEHEEEGEGKQEEKQKQQSKEVNEEKNMKKKPGGESKKKKEEEKNMDPLFIERSDDAGLNSRQGWCWYTLLELSVSVVSGIVTGFSPDPTSIQCSIAHAVISIFCFLPVVVSFWAAKDCTRGVFILRFDNLYGLVFNALIGVTIFVTNLSHVFDPAAFNFMIDLLGMISDCLSSFKSIYDLISVVMQLFVVFETMSTFFSHIFFHVILEIFDKKNQDGDDDKEAKQESEKRKPSAAASLLSSQTFQVLNREEKEEEEQEEMTQLQHPLMATKKKATKNRHGRSQAWDLEKE